jgi:hypothetical protein
MNESKNLCMKCNKPMILYYGEYCPRCVKPEVKTKKIYNLYQCLYYVETTSQAGFKEEFWSLLCDYNAPNNDTFITLHRPTDDNRKNWDKLDYFLDILFDKVGINESSALFEVSW